MTVDSIRPSSSSWCSRRTLPGRCRAAITLNPPPNRPDPAIYSQAPVLATAGAATWDNPDIVVYATPQLVGGEWRETQWILNNALVSVHNHSMKAAAINTRVDVSYGPVGIGMPKKPLMSQMISLAAGGMQQLSIPIPPAVLSQPEQALALFVDLYHPFDSDTTNDHGESSSVITLVGAGIGAGTSFDLGNTTNSPITYNLTAEPNTVQADVEFAQVTVAPGATQSVIVAWIAPSGTTATSFTVIARDGQGNLQGGFTNLLYSS